MIYCGSSSGSYLGKCFVPVLVPVPDPDSFSSTENLYKIFPFSVRISIVSQKVGLYFFYFLTFVLHFMLDPVPEPECVTVPVPIPLSEKLRFLR
jgi:hypothetical protein